MSNMAGITNDMYPEGTVATTEGFTGPHGEVLLNVDFTQAEVDAFNGTSSDLPETMLRHIIRKISGQLMKTSKKIYLGLSILTD